MAANEYLTSIHALYKTIAALVLKRENSSKFARSHKKHHLNIATEFTTAVVNEDGVLDVIEATES